MITGDPKKWAALLALVGAIAAVIGWGAASWEPTDFYDLHDFVGPGLAVTMALALSATIFGSTSIFPSMIRKSEYGDIAVSCILALFVFVAVIAGGLGVNHLGARPVPREVAAKLIHFAVQKGSGGKESRTFGIFELEQGETIRVTRSKVEALELKVGDTVPVRIYRGNLFDWGLLQVAQASSNAR